MPFSPPAPGSGCGARSRRGPATARIATLTAFLLGVSALATCQSPPPPSLAARGEQALDEGSLERAAALFEEALAASPNDGRALLGRARVLTASDDPEGALGVYRRLAQVAPPYFGSQARPYYAQTLLAAGELRLRRGQSRDALVALRALQELDPAYPGLLPVLGRALAAEASRAQMEGRTNDALALHTETTRVAPQRAEHFIAAVELLLATGRQSEAKALLARARKHHPNNRELQALTLATLGVY